MTTIDNNERKKEERRGYGILPIFRPHKYWDTGLLKSCTKTAKQPDFDNYILFVSYSSTMGPKKKYDPSNS